MRFKRTIHWLVAGISLLLLLGCERQGRNTVPHGKPYTVAILVVSDIYLPLSAEGLKEGMRQLGYQEGADIAYRIYNAKGDPKRLDALAKEAVGSKPDVICPSTSVAIDVLKATGTTIPVVFLESMYPVELGVVKSLTKPGGTFTGVSNMTGPMSGKRLELLKKICPSIKRVAVICNPDNRVSALSLDATRVAAADLGLQLDVQQIHNLKQLDAAIGRLRTSAIDALVLNPDFMVFSRLPQLIELAKDKKIPTMGIDPTQVQAGILASYGGGLKEIAMQAAGQVDRVLRGEAPADIPIEAPRKYRLFINMKTADAIGVKLPQDVLYQAEGYYR